MPQGGYTPENDGANAAKAQALYIYLFSESGFDEKIVEESGRSNGSIVLCGLDDIVNFK